MHLLLLSFLIGQNIPDSTHILERFVDDFKIDLDEHLTQEERAISRAFQRMLSEGALFAGFAWRFTLSDNGKLMVKSLLGGGVVGNAISQFAGMGMRKNVWAQGTGRMTREQILKGCFDDIDACSVFLAKKPYMMGDRVSFIDCLMFGFLQTIFFTFHCSTDENPIKDHMLKRQNLDSYRQRIQNEVFPDWKEIAENKESTRTWAPDL